MRQILLTIACVLVLTGAASAETIKASVNGLVCAFCATGIEKSFKARSEVEHVKVDLEHKLVTIETKPEQSLNDDQISKIITDAGYSVVKITRAK